MHGKAIHYNSRIFLRAWQAIAKAGTEPQTSLSAMDNYSELLRGLFLLRQNDNLEFRFGKLGATMTETMEQNIADANFCSLWVPYCRDFVDMGIEMVVQREVPMILHGLGLAASGGKFTRYEMVLAPLDSAVSASPRILGYYQQIGSGRSLGGERIDNLSLFTVHLPVFAINRRQTLRLVKSDRNLSRSL